QLVKKYEKCQRHGQITHIPAEYMMTINTPIPFAQWGVELVGPLPMGTGQKKFLVVAVDYFSKWVEAEPLAKITEEKMIQFMFYNICCRFGVSKVLISDNGTQFQGKRIQAWCLDMGIKQRFSSVAHPQVNDQYLPNVIRSLGDDLSYLKDRAILATTLVDVVESGYEYMSSLDSSEVRTYLSSDTACKSDVDSLQDLHTPEFLNGIKCSELLNHKLHLKIDTPMVLLRNIDHQWS
ncbi:Unknown protein, partial [Striga hermonthica]